MEAIIRNVFIEKDLTYRLYEGQDKIFTQEIDPLVLELGESSVVEADLEKQIITKIYKLVPIKSCYCNLCGLRFESVKECLDHSQSCKDKGYLRHPEGEGLDGVYNRRRKINSNNG